MWWCDYPVFLGIQSVGPVPAPCVSLQEGMIQKAVDVVVEIDFGEEIGNC